MNKKEEGVLTEKMTSEDVEIVKEHLDRKKLKKSFDELAKSSIFDEGKKNMKEYELKVRRKKKIVNLKKRIISRRKRKRIYAEIKNV